MSNFRRTTLASVNMGVSDAQAADSEALEKRIREPEARLEKLDQAAALSAKPATAVAAPAAPSPEVVKLTRKVNTLERKLEVQDEEIAGAFKKLPNFEAGADGFKITSSDKQHQLRIGGTVQTDYRNFLGDNAAVWAPNAFISFDYEYVSFTGGAGTTTGTGAKTLCYITNRPSEQVLSDRFQLAF